MIYITSPRQSCYLYVTFYSKQRQKLVQLNVSELIISSESYFITPNSFQLNITSFIRRIYSLYVMLWLWWYIFFFLTIMNRLIYVT